MRRLVSAAVLAAAVLAPPTAAIAEPRDPFSSIVDEAMDLGMRPPLERYPVDAMKVHGVVSRTASPRALVVLPDGTTHVVRVGDAVGPNLGRVKAIESGKVVVVEAWFHPLTMTRQEREIVLLPG